MTHMGHMNLGKKRSKELGEELEEKEGVGLIKAHYMQI